MKSSDLIRLSGLAAAIAGALFIIIHLITLIILNFGQEALELHVRTVISPIAGTLLVLGLIGLYARQSEVIDVIGVIGFLFALFGTVLALAGNGWANSLAYFGWALFGVSCWQARVYPPKAIVLLIIGALIAAPLSTLRAGNGTTIVYLSVGASIVFDAALVWLGVALFSGKRVGSEQILSDE